MARQNLLSTRTVSYLELIGNGRAHRVPAYQRDYSWTEEQWEDLWLDLEGLRQNEESQHYMGAVVEEGRTDREFMVIDGQQRLATLSLLALAVIARLHALADAGIASDENRARARELRSRFIGERDPASLVESSRLVLNHTDNAFYQDYLVALREPLNPRGLPGSNRLLWDCFRYFRRKLGAVVELESDGQKLAELLSQTAARQLLFILITVDDDVNAYTVFETLNARGLELTTTDLLKNFLFSRLRTSADLEALERRWGALVATVGQAEFPTFLRYHLLCEQPRVRKERLFKMMRERVSSPEEVFALLQALEQRAVLFAALQDPNHGFWAELGEVRASIRELQLYRVQQMMPLLFAAWERFPAHDFLRLLKLVSIISFRYTVIGRLNTHPLEPAYHAGAKEILTGKAATPAQVFALLRPLIYVEDDDFRARFAAFSLNGGASSSRLAKYILARLEHDASGRACDPETDPASIEHVLPQNPSEEWEAVFPRGLWERSIYRLGNLALLETSANRRVGNAVYAAKRAAYGASVYELTRRISEHAPEEWTYDLLEDRQRRMAVRAVHIWRSDLDQAEN